MTCEDREREREREREKGRLMEEKQTCPKARHPGGLRLGGAIMATLGLLTRYKPLAISRMSSLG
jgi:hypothetical protein